MATDKQIAANRLNAKKSTGPRTPEGKARSKGNARRHSALAAVVLLQCENPERFLRLARQLYRTLRPEDLLEANLVDMMITARWRQLRHASLEVAGLDYEYEALRTSTGPYQNLSIPMRTTRAYSNFAGDCRALQLLNRAEARIQRQFDSAFASLRALWAFKGKAMNGKQTDAGDLTEI